MTIHGIGYQAFLMPLISTLQAGVGLFNPEGIEFYGRSISLRQDHTSDITTTVNHLREGDLQANTDMA